jgi:hypothetical protein
MSISGAAGDIFTAVDKVVRGIKPEHGMVRVHFVGVDNKEATVQALALVPSTAAK